MVLLGCKPPGRNTEQHDIWFGIGKSIRELVPHIRGAWPEADKGLHIDAWRTVSEVDGMGVEVVPKQYASGKDDRLHLFFINLGGYKENIFEEFHYKVMVACRDKAEAIRQAKDTAFYRHTGFQGARSHVDDKYGVDVDDICEIEEILSPHFKEHYALKLTPLLHPEKDQWHIGYLKLGHFFGLI